MSDTIPPPLALATPSGLGYPPSLGEARLLSDAELSRSLADTMRRWDGARR